MSTDRRLALVRDTPPTPPQPPRFDGEWLERTVRSTISFGSDDASGVFVPREIEGEIAVTSGPEDRPFLSLEFRTLVSGEHISERITASLPDEALEPLGLLIVRLVRNARRDGLLALPPRDPPTG